jgi:hypothetical protein
MIGAPSQEKRLVPSGITPRPWVARIATHRLLFALPAFRRVERDDVVALFHAGHARADLGHDTRALMAKDRWENALGIATREGEFIGMADAGRLDLD